MAEMNKLDPLRASRGGEIAVDEVFEEEYYWWPDEGEVVIDPRTEIVIFDGA